MLGSRAYIVGIFLCVLAGCSGASNTTPLPNAASDPPGSPAITPQVVQQNDGSHFVEFAAPAAPYGITQGADGNAWFTEQNANAIGSIAYNGVTHQYALPTVGSGPTQIASGADGNLWFVEHGTARIGKMTTSGAVTQYALPSGEIPLAITSGPNSALWFTATISKASKGGTTKPGPDVVGELSTSGTMTQYMAPLNGGTPRYITAGADGALWFTDSTLNKICRMTTAGKFTILSVATANSGVGQIISTTSALYFLEQTANKIGAVSTTGLAEYANTSANALTSLAASPGATITLIGSAGVQTFNTTAHTFSAPLAPPSGPGLSMSPESDGNLWFTENAASKIGVYVLQLQTTTPTSISFTAPGQTQTFTLHETNYSGAFSATSSNTAVATVSATASPANTFTVTAVSAGTATISVADSKHNTTTVSVTVTTTAININ